MNFIKFLAISSVFLAVVVSVAARSPILPGERIITPTTRPTTAPLDQSVIVDLVDFTELRQADEDNVFSERQQGGSQCLAYFGLSAFKQKCIDKCKSVPTAQLNQKFCSLTKWLSWTDRSTTICNCGGFV